MKKLIAVALLSLLFVTVLYAGAVPSFRTGEKIVTRVEKGSIEETALLAAKTSFDENWLLRFTTGEKVLEEVRSRILSCILPMKDVVLLERKGTALALYSLSSGDFISFTFSDGLINSVSVLDVD